MPSKTASPPIATRIIFQLIESLISITSGGHLEGFKVCVQSVETLPFSITRVIGDKQSGYFTRELHAPFIPDNFHKFYNVLYSLRFYRKHMLLRAAQGSGKLRNGNREKQQECTNHLFFGVFI